MLYREELLHSQHDPPEAKYTVHLYHCGEWAASANWAHVHEQALAQLRADLAAWTKLAGDAKQHARIRRTLQHR
jgi:hypothetical protein